MRPGLKRCGGPGVGAKGPRGGHNRVGCANAALVGTHIHYDPPPPPAMTPVEGLVAAASAYVALGLAFAVPFALVGAGRIDPDARASTWGFKLMVLPGAALLWPLLARRWARGTPPPVERTPHKVLTPSATPRAPRGPSR